MTENASSTLELDLAKVQKYQRGNPLASTKKIQNHQLKHAVRKSEKRTREAAEHAARAEILLAQDVGYLEAEGMERTYKFKQEAIVPHLDVTSAKKAFQLTLPQLGPYTLNYSRNGRHLLIGGKKGHVASLDWRTGQLLSEIQLQETVRDVQWLHNASMYAVAQKKHVYIYEKTGMEVHCLRDHIEVNRMEFLPYHHLLVTVGNAGYLQYQDTSTGKLVMGMKTRLGRCDVMCQNPWNAIMHLGHTNGTVTMWSPNMTSPVVKMLCHKGPVLSATVDQTGHYMVTSGLDGQMKVFDIRTYQPLQQYYTATPARSLSISQKGLLAASYGPHVTIWKDAFLTKQQSPYMSHLQESTVIRNVQFCPFDDVLGLGHSMGISSIVVPGSGEPNYDALEANPYETTKQRQESEIRGLLDKIQPEMITLHPEELGKVDQQHQQALAERKERQDAANGVEKTGDKEKKKMRGRTKAMKRYLKKQSNVLDAKKVRIREELERKQRELKQKRGEKVDELSAGSNLPASLKRFQRKGN